MAWQLPEIPKQGLTHLITQISEVTGFRSSSLRPNLVEASIKGEMRRAQLDDFSSFRAYLQEDPKNLQSLIESCMVGETWFFRQSESFQHVQDLLKSRYSYGSLQKPLKILSLGCSSGEEVYSLLMTAEQSGWPLQDCEVMGLDLHSGSIEKAKRACYGQSSFRGTDRDSLRHYFEAEGDQLRLIEALRSVPKWVQGNALDPALWPPLGRFHIIFCRNLLVYLRHEARSQVAKFLYNALEEGGCLYVGPTDTVELVEQGFSSLGSPRAFAFERGQGVLAQPICSQQDGYPLEAQENILTVIEEAANKGDLASAEALLQEARIKGAASSCRLAFLMGVLRHAQGRYLEAEESFMKALERDPAHYESLVYLCLLAENRGDLASARKWRQRADQLSQEAGL